MNKKEMVFVTINQDEKISLLGSGPGPASNLPCPFFALVHIQAAWEKAKDGVIEDFVQAKVRILYLQKEALKDFSIEEVLVIFAWSDAHWLQCTQGLGL